MHLHFSYLHSCSATSSYEWLDSMSDVFFFTEYLFKSHFILFRWQFKSNSIVKTSFHTYKYPNPFHLCLFPTESLELGWQREPRPVLKTVRRQPWKWRSADRTARSPPGRTPSAGTPAPRQTARTENPTPNPTAPAKLSRPSTTTPGWPTGAESRKWFTTKWTSSTAKVGLSCSRLLQIMWDYVNGRDGGWYKHDICEYILWQGRNDARHQVEATLPADSQY